MGKMKYGVSNLEGIFKSLLYTRSEEESANNRRVTAVI